MFYVAPLPSVENRRGENWEKQQASVRRRGGGFDFCLLTCACHFIIALVWSLRKNEHRLTDGAEVLRVYSNNFER